MKRAQGLSLGFDIAVSVTSYAASGTGSRSGERAGEAGEDAEVGVKRDLLKPAYSDRAESPLVLQSAELVASCEPGELSRA